MHAVVDGLEKRKNKYFRRNGDGGKVERWEGGGRDCLGEWNLNGESDVGGGEVEEGER